MRIWKGKADLLIRFRLRQTDGPMKRQLYIRLTVEGEQASAYTSGIWVRPDRWNQKEQRVTGWDKVAVDTNQQLETIREQHRAIFTEMALLYFKGEGTLPKVALVKAGFTKLGTTRPQSGAGNNSFSRAVSP